MNLPHSTATQDDEQLNKLMQLWRLKLIQLASHVDQGQREFLVERSRSRQVETPDTSKQSIT